MPCLFVLSLHLNHRGGGRVERWPYVDLPTTLFPLNRNARPATTPIVTALPYNDIKRQGFLVPEMGLLTYPPGCSYLTMWDSPVRANSIWQRYLEMPLLFTMFSSLPPLFSLSWLQNWEDNDGLSSMIHPRNKATGGTTLILYISW